MHIRRLLVLLAVMLAFPASVLAWTPPSVTANCAPDTEHYAFTVTLSGTEDNHDYQWSFDQHMDNAVTVNGHDGANDLVTPRGGDTLYVRWASDHDSNASAQANSTLCEQPSPKPSARPSVKPSPKPKPTTRTHTPLMTLPPTSTAATTDPTAPTPLLWVVIGGFIVLLIVIDARATRRRNRRMAHRDHEPWV